MSESSGERNGRKTFHVRVGCFLLPSEEKIPKRKEKLEDLWGGRGEGL